MNSASLPSHSPATARALRKLRSRICFSLKEAKRVGLSQPTLSRLTARGYFSRRTRGLYVPGELSSGKLAKLDFISATQTFGASSYIGGLSALFYYDLIDSAPSRIWVVVSPGQRTRHKIFRLIRTRASLKTGIEERGQYRIASLERALIDALRFHRLWGRQTAIAAVRVALVRKRTSLGALFDMARALGVSRLFEKYADFISPESYGRI